MPASFCIIGLIEIGVLFWAEVKLFRKILLVSGTSTIMFGYFQEPIFFERISINLFILLGLIIVFLGVAFGCKWRQILVVTLMSVAICLCYLFMCVKDYNNLSYFEPVVLTSMLGLISLFLKGIEVKIVLVVFSFIICEFSSYLVVGDKLLFYPLFSVESLNCIVFIIISVLMCFALRKFALKKGDNINEKV